MNPDILVILDYSLGRLIKIRLSQTELDMIEQYDDFEEFLNEQIAPTYNLRMQDCYWMLTDSLEELSYGFDTNN